MRIKDSSSEFMRPRMFQRTAQQRRPCLKLKSSERICLAVHIDHQKPAPEREDLERLACRHRVAMHHLVLIVSFPEVSASRMEARCTVHSGCLACFACVLTMCTRCTQICHISEQATSPLSCTLQSCLQMIESTEKHESKAH